MRSSGNVRRSLLTAGGVLSIVAGIYQVVSNGLIIAEFVVSHLYNWWLIYVLVLPGLPEEWASRVMCGGNPLSSADYSVRLTIIEGCLVALGIVAIVGGVAAIRRKSFGLSLAGAICALPSVFLGIVAVVLVALGKRDFEVKA